MFLSSLRGLQIFSSDYYTLSVFDKSEPLDEYHTIHILSSINEILRKANLVCES